MNILLVRLSSFGDVVFTLPLARALRGEGDRLSWAVEGPLAELVEGAPYVDEVLVATTRAWRRRPFSEGTRSELRSFLSSLRAFEPDVVVDAQGLLKSAWITLAARARRKVGFGFRTATEKVNALVTHERVDVPAGTHVVDRGLALAEHVLGRTGFPRTPDVSHLVARPAPEVDDWVDARSARPFAILQPFSSRATKEWDAGETVAFCRALAAKILGKAPLAVRYALEAVNHGLELPFDEAELHEAALFGLCVATGDMKEGVAAFLERRPARFTGK